MIMIKEIKHIFRDSYFSRQLLTVVFIVIAYIFLIHSDYYQYDLLTSYRKIWFGFYFNISILIFISIYLSTTIGFSLVSYEKYVILKLKQLPFKSLAKLIWNKLIVTFLLVMIITSVIYWDYVFSVRNILDFDLSFHLYGYFYIMFTIFFIVMLNISFGMYFFNHKEENYITYTSLVTFVISISIVTLLIIYYGNGFKSYYLYITTEFRDEQIYPNIVLLKTLIVNYTFVFFSSIILLRLGFNRFKMYEV